MEEDTGPERGQAYEMQVRVFPRQGGPRPAPAPRGQDWVPLRLACQAGPSVPGLGLLRERNVMDVPLRRRRRRLSPCLAPCIRGPGAQRAVPHGTGNPRTGGTQHMTRCGRPSPRVSARGAGRPSGWLRRGLDSSHIAYHRVCNSACANKHTYARLSFVCSTHAFGTRTPC